MEKKYELTDDVISFGGTRLRRIRARRDFSDVKAGDLGGWIKKEGNLSQFGSAWVYDEAKVYGCARIDGDAKVCGYAKVYGKAQIFGGAKVCGYAEVYENAEVYGCAEVCDYAEVHGNADIRNYAVVKSDADYIVFKNFWSSGRYFTWTRSDNMWSVGCFHGTGEELIQKAYADSEISGREYERIVRYVENILADKKKQK